ncbi:MAG: hypothetical protein WAT81_02330 [Candidatus Moraniibacteriota bacterium]
MGKFAPECSEEYQPVFVSIEKLIRLFEGGRLAELRPVFQLLNRRLNTSPSPKMREKHRALRQAIVRFQLMVGSFAKQDPELAELIYVLGTVNRVFGISSVRTTLLSDRRTLATYVGLFCHEVDGVVDTILQSLAVPPEPVRQSA